MHTEFKANHSSQSRDMSKQIFIFVASFFFFISHTCIFGYKTWMHILIELTLGSHKELIKAHLYTNFGWNLIRIHRDLWRIFRSKVCHTNRVSRTWNLACRRSNHHSSVFLWFEMNWTKSHQDMKPNPTSVKISNRFLWIKNLLVFRHTRKNA